MCRERDVRFLLLAVAVAFASALFGFEIQQNGIRTALEASVACGDVVGVVSIVTDPDYVEQVDCASWADVENRVPMRPDTMFALFSSSKSVAGTAVMILVDEGKLSLDDPVSKYLPEFADVRVEKKGADGSVVLAPPKRPVTVRDLTAHSRRISG